MTLRQLLMSLMVMQYPSRCPDQAYHAKERVVDLQAELTHLQQQLSQVQQAETVARGAAAAGAEAQARSERELADIKELGVRMFKQVGWSWKREGS